MHIVLIRGGVEVRIRTKLMKDGHIDTVIGLPANLFFSTGNPVCVLVLKKCKKPDDAATAKHNAFLKELGLPLLPSFDTDLPADG